MITIDHQAPSPFPVYTPKGERIVDERCSCGHLRSEHADRFAYGHGGCRCALATPGVYCGCPQFTWVGHVFEHITAGDEKITPMPNVADCTLHDFGAGVMVLEADHGVRDDKGRKIGGRVDIDPGTGINSGWFYVRVQAMRNGVAFGALRKATKYKNVREALTAAARKVLEQRKGFADRYPEDKPAASPDERKIPRNPWMVGYRAAMDASPEDLTEAGEAVALERARLRFKIGDHAAAAFRAGWRSVLRCERRTEVPA